MMYKGYEIAQSNNRGGKAGKGYNKTATIQVLEPIGGGNYLLKAQYRFPVGDSEKRQAAIAKARAWIDREPSARPHIPRGDSQGLVRRG